MALKLTIFINLFGIYQQFRLPQLPQFLSLSCPLELTPGFTARNFFGLLFIFFIPGYAFARVAFVKKMSKPQPTSLDIIELIGLSVGLSIALVSLVGLALYYSPFKFDLGAVVVSLFVITFVFSTAALFKEQQINKTYLINRYKQL